MRSADVPRGIILGIVPPKKTKLALTGILSEREL